MIRWPIADLKDPWSDLCTQVNGVYFDVIFNKFQSMWTCRWGGPQTMFWTGFPTREAAIQWFDDAELELSRGRTPDAPPAPAYLRA